MDVLAIVVTFTALAAVIVALRFYTRFFLVKAPGWDDGLILGALIVDCAFTAFVLVERHYGIGKPIAELSLDSIESQLFYLWISVPFYNLALIFAKLSALLLYARLFRPRWFLIATYIVMSFLVIAGLWMTLSGFIYCIPIRDFWNANEEIRAAHCLPDGPVWFTNAGIQLATDIVILAMPMPLLWRLQMPRRQKLGVLLVFSIGIFIVATSATRMYELSKIVRYGDFTKENAPAALWSSLEANISIICVCLPPLHPLISRIFSFCFLPQPLHSTAASKGHSHTTQLSERHVTNGMIWYNEYFNPEPAGYSASISKVNTNDGNHSNEEGIRVLRELRMQSDSVCVTPILRPHSANDHSNAVKGEGTSNSSAGNGSVPSNPSIEWDLADFEFPDYKHKMNAPI